MTSDGPRRARGVRAWAVWHLPVPLRAAVAVVELTAVALLAAGLTVPLRPDEARLGAVVLLAAVLHLEIGRNVERLRRRLAVAEFHVNLSSVWFLAAAVVLPPGWAGLVALLIHVHQCRRSAGRRVVPHRQVFTAGVFVLAAVAASATMAALRAVLDGSVVVLGAGILVFFTVNTALVAGAIAVSDLRAGLADVAGNGDENVLETATLCLGALVGTVMTVQPWLLLLALPPVHVLHRAVLVRHLERAASTDAKTGLLNSTAWHVRAEQALGRRRAPAVGLLVLDLDHFKDVNDSHGHLAGDDVLAAVAEALRAEVRGDDLVGRFGGEEFVVLVAGGTASPPEQTVPAVADRIRRRVASLAVDIDTLDGALTVTGVTVSIGVALCTGTDLRALLQDADGALYTAKRAGRNQVRLSPPPAIVAAVRTTLARPRTT